MNLDTFREELSCLSLHSLKQLCTHLADELEARVQHDAAARINDAAATLGQVLAGRRGRCGP